MPARERTAIYPQMSGRAGFTWQGPFDPALYQLSNGYGICKDNIKVPGDCYPLDVDKLSTIGGYLNRSYNGSDSNDHWYNQYVCDFYRSTVQGAHMSVPGLPSAAYNSTNAARRTNPSRPYVDVPVNILDLPDRIGDIGRSFKRMLDRMPRPARRIRPLDARSLRREAGGQWLRWKFFIEPLVGDIVRAANAQDQISRRIKEVNRLYSGRGLRRTVSQGGHSRHFVDPYVTVQSLYDTWHVPVTTSTTVNHRTHVRWAPQNKVGVKPAPDVVRQWATRAVFGATVDLSTMWELTPWSWLADWFGNVGDYLAANRNIIPGRLVGVYPMGHTRTTQSFPGYSQSARGRISTLSSAQRIRERKTRAIGTASIIAHFGFLNGSQMGILAALASSRS
jgi:hypothetical protein